MMLSFCNKSHVHPFLSLLPNSNDNGTVLDIPLPNFHHHHHHHHDQDHHHHHQNIFTTADLGGSFEYSSNAPKSNCFEPPATISPPYSSTSAKRDPGGIGFLDEVGGSVDGLMSCTESLGFESFDERTVDDQIEDVDHSHDDDQYLLCKSSSSNMASSNNLKLHKTLEEKEKKKFPPPLSSLNKDGKRNFYLRAVRTDGRLELKEVKIGWPETLLASRQDGRLRLDLVLDDEEVHEEEELEEEEEVNEDFPLNIDEGQEEKKEEVIETIEEIVDDEEEVSEWKFPVTSGGGDGYRRCYELKCHHHHGHNNHHHDLHVWGQHCVPTR